MFAVVWEGTRDVLLLHFRSIESTAFGGFSSLTCQELFQIPEWRDTPRLKMFFFLGLFSHAVRISIMSHDGSGVLVYLGAIKHAERETC